MSWLVLGNWHLGLGKSHFFEKKLERCKFKVVTCYLYNHLSIIKIKNASINTSIVQYSIHRKYQNLNGRVYFLSINPIVPCVVINRDSVRTIVRTNCPDNSLICIVQLSGQKCWTIGQFRKEKKIKKLAILKLILFYIWKSTINFKLIIFKYH